LAAGAIGTAAVAATSPWGYQAAYGYGPGAAGAISNAGYYGNSGGGYYASSPWGDYACQPPHAYDCRPHAAKDWGRAW
jgi:hypothetical protein